MKRHLSLALIQAAGTLFVTATSVRGSDTDDRIDASVGRSYVFKKYLKDDSIKTASKDDVVTLIGIAEPGDCAQLEFLRRITAGGNENGSAPVTIETERNICYTQLQ